MDDNAPLPTLCITVLCDICVSTSVTITPKSTACVGIRCAKRIRRLRAAVSQLFAVDAGVAAGDGELAVEDVPLELAGALVLSAGLELLPASADFAASPPVEAAGFAEE